MRGSMREENKGLGGGDHGDMSIDRDRGRSKGEILQLLFRREDLNS